MSLDAKEYVPLLPLVRVQLDKLLEVTFSIRHQLRIALLVVMILVGCVR